MIKVIIVDDEIPAINKMIKLLADCGMPEIAGVFTDPQEALDFVRRTRVDLVFLEIEMPDINGIELANSIIDLWQGIEVVFVTAYHQYPVEAFQLNALDYLMKPVTVGRLMQTLSRIKTFLWQPISRNL